MAPAYGLPAPVGFHPPVREVIGSGIKPPLSPAFPVADGWANTGPMSNQPENEKKDYDPANQSPAEGQSHPIPAADRGKDPNIDPAAKDQPAEGGREEAGQ